MSFGLADVRHSHLPRSRQLHPQMLLQPSSSSSLVSSRIIALCSARTILLGLHNLFWISSGWALLPIRLAHRKAHPALYHLPVLYTRRSPVHNSASASMYPGPAQSVDRVEAFSLDQPLRRRQPPAKLLIAHCLSSRARLMCLQCHLQIFQILPDGLGACSLFAHLWTCLLTNAPFRTISLIGLSH